MLAACVPPVFRPPSPSFFFTMPSILIALVVLLLAIFALQHKRRGFTPFPGPSPAPILGNLLQLPTTKVWERLFEWGLTYGTRTL